jgi:hypothetical protein
MSLIQKSGVVPYLFGVAIGFPELKLTPKLSLKFEFGWEIVVV